MPLNPNLDTLSDYPFEALRTLLNPVTPRVNDSPILMSVGEPQHQPPALLTETLMAHAHEWNKYPPMAGTPELRQAIADWLTRRYRLPAGALDPERHILNLAGTKEGLYLFSTIAVPRDKGGRQPVVFVPNPYYLVYNGAATMNGAEAVFLDATRNNAFLPDLDAIPRDQLERAALFYLCSPANPQGTVASLDYLKQAITLARRHDFVLAVDECYAEIYDRAPPSGALEACAALGPGATGLFHNAVAAAWIGNGTWQPPKSRRRLNSAISFGSPATKPERSPAALDRFDSEWKTTTLSNRPFAPGPSAAQASSAPDGGARS